MNKEILKEAWIPILSMLIVWILSWIFCGCSSTVPNNDQLDTLRVQIQVRDKLIEKYELFRQISKDIYMTEVDSTGDGYDETDKGVEFWTLYNNIDTLTRLINR